MRKLNRLLANNDRLVILLRNGKREVLHQSELCEFFSALAVLFDGFNDNGRGVYVKDGVAGGYASLASMMRGF